MTSTPMASRPMSRLAPTALMGIFLVIAALVFFGVYIAAPVSGHFYALITIGIMSIVFGLVAYFLEALSADPWIQRGLAWGFGAMGFATLFLTVLVLPTNVLSSGEELWAIIVLLIFLLAWIGGIGWRSRARLSAEQRVQRRAEWASRPPPSAFSYGTATTVAPPPPSPPPPEPAPGGAR